MEGTFWKNGCLSGTKPGLNLTHLLLVRMHSIIFLLSKIRHSLKK